jgi:hypothetical protein
MTLGNAAAAGVRLIMWRRICQHEGEAEPTEMAAQYGAETPCSIGASGSSVPAARLGPEAGDTAIVERLGMSKAWSSVPPIKPVSWRRAPARRFFSSATPGYACQPTHPIGIASFWPALATRASDAAPPRPEPAQSRALGTRPGRLSSIV